MRSVMVLLDRAATRDPEVAAALLDEIKGAARFGAFPVRVLHHEDRYSGIGGALQGNKRPPAPAPRGALAAPDGAA